MPKSFPLPNWKGQDAYIIGGGSSLSRFDFSKLKNRNTIGCNHAFQLGEEVCKIAIFGDYRFWEKFKSWYESYDGWVTTNHQLASVPHWLHFFPRLDHGLCDEASGKLAWNGNTGAAALNLALVLGAQRVFLLGFDLYSVGSHAHWHQDEMEQQGERQYEKFREGFARVAAELPTVYPDREVYNISKGDSKLNVFTDKPFEFVLL